jgi:hypothetical protein
VEQPLTLVSLEWAHAWASALCSRSGLASSTQSSRSTCAATKLIARDAVEGDPGRTHHELEHHWRGRRPRTSPIGSDTQSGWRSGQAARRSGRSRLRRDIDPRPRARVAAARCSRCSARRSGNLFVHAEICAGDARDWRTGLPGGSRDRAWRIGREILVRVWDRRVEYTVRVVALNERAGSGRGAGVRARASSGECRVRAAS